MNKRSEFHRKHAAISYGADLAQPFALRPILLARLSKSIRGELELPTRLSTVLSFPKPRHAWLAEHPRRAEAKDKIDGRVDSIFAYVQSLERQERVKVTPFRALRTRLKRAFTRFSRYFDKGSQRAHDTFTVAAEQFCTTSLIWATRRLSSRPEHLSRARTLCDQIMIYSKDRNLDHDRLDFPLVRYLLRTVSLRAPGITVRESEKGRHEFGGLILYLAATLPEATGAWTKPRKPAAQLLSEVYEALRSAMLAIIRPPGADDADQIDEARHSMLARQLRQFGLELELDDLDGLPGCLIITGAGSSVYVARDSSQDEREWYAFHELGHLLLTHRPASAYAFDIAMMPDLHEKQLFDKQETEADQFAHLWHHVFKGVLEHIFEKGTDSRHETSKPDRRVVLRDAFAA